MGRTNAIDVVDTTNSNNNNNKEQGKPKQQRRLVEKAKEEQHVVVTTALTLKHSSVKDSKIINRQTNQPRVVAIVVVAIVVVAIVVAIVVVASIGWMDRPSLVIPHCGSLVVGW